MSETPTTGEWIVRSLLAHDVDTIFGVPGVHMYEFNDAVARAAPRLRFIHTRHEQGAGYMAYGYAKASGRPGVFTVVPGPGVLNAGAALCTAYGANAPTLCVTGNIMSDLIGRGRGQLHELPDQLATLRGFVKAAERIDHPAAAAATTAWAFSKMRSGRQGPVVIEAPWDVMGRRSAGPAPTLGAPQPPPPVDLDAVNAAAALIAAAKNPLIMVGGGAYEAGPQVAALARRLQAPVVSHRSGKGILPDDDPLALSPVSAYEYWRGCDLLIGIGSRLELQHMRWRWRPTGLKTIRIDVDPLEMMRLKPDVGLVADAVEGVSAVLQALETGPSLTSRAEECAVLRARAERRIAEIQPQVDYLRAIRDVLPRDGFFVEEICQAGFTARFAFPTYAPRRYVTCGYQETLGFGYDTALGVKAAFPGNKVVSISGDGGFLFGAQEMATAAQHNLDVVAVVFDNSSYGNVLRDQQVSYGGRVSGAHLTNPDFKAMAESFGLAAFRAETPSALRATLEKAFALDAPALIHVPMQPGAEASPWPMLHPAPHAG